MFKIFVCLAAISQLISLEKIKMIEQVNNHLILASTILQQLDHCELRIHYDNYTLNNLNKILNNDIFTAKILRNYDNKIIKEEKYTSIHYLNIVYLKDAFVFEKYSSIEYKLNHRDIVFFVIDYKLNLNDDDSSNKLWHIDGLNRCAALFIFNSFNGAIYHSCYYCGNRTGILKQIGSLNDVPYLSGYINPFTNFNRHLFRIAFIKRPPYFSCIYNESTCIPIFGEGYVLRTLSEYLNFRYELYEFSHEGHPDGELNDIINAISNREYDWAVGGVSLTVKRQTITDFSRYMKTEGYTVLFASQEDIWLTVRNFMTVFNLLIWIALLGTLLLIGFFIKISTVVLKLKNSASIFAHAQAAFFGILEQSIPVQTSLFKITSIKLLFAIWWLLALTITTVYRSKLTSQLIIVDNNEPDRIGGLIQRNYTFQVNNRDWSALKEKLQRSNDAAYLNILQNAKNDLRICDAVLAALNGKVAIIEEETLLKYHVHHYCNDKLKLLTNLQISKLRIVRQNLFPATYQSWSMQAGTPFRLKFSKVFGRLDSYGFFNFWYNIKSFKPITFSNEKTTADNPELNINKLLAPLFILIFGYIISIILFILEKLLYKKSTCL